MTAAAAMAALETRLESLANFDAADVTISDWGVLDNEVSAAPFAVISRTGVFNTTLNPMAKYTAIRRIRVTLYEAFTDWKATQPALRNLMDTVELELMSNPVLGITPGSGSNFIVTGIEGLGEEYVYDQYLTPEELAEATPTYLGQPFNVIVEEDIVLTTGEFA